MDSAGDTRRDAVTLTNLRRQPQSVDNMLQTLGLACDHPGRLT